MPAKVEILMGRRDALVIEAARQRTELAQAYHKLDRPVRVAETVFNLAQGLRRRPWIVAIAAAVVGALGFKSVQIPEKIAPLWNGLKGAYQVWQKFQK
jgi:uncharacterized protein YgbK (DUF1537 family)